MTAKAARRTAIALSVASLVLTAHAVRRPIPRPYLELVADDEREERGPRYDSPGEAASFRLMRMRDENGVIPDGALMRAKAQADVLRAGARFGPAAAGITRSSWAWLGPGNIGGRIRAVAIHPSTPSTIFIGSVGGGIWKSTNSGGTWAPVDDFMANLAVSSIVFQPGTPSTMYAATGEGFYNFDRLRGAGIFKSTDSGVTWTQLASTANSSFFFVNRLAMSADGLTLLAATSVGLYRSIDGGTSFPRVLAVSAPLRADLLDVKFLHGSSTDAVVSGFSTNAYYSTNGGATWTAATGPTPAGTFIRVEIGVGGASAPNTVYLSIDTSPTPQVWKSTNGGAAYTMAAGNPNHLGTQGWYDNVIWVDPTNAARVVVGGTTLAATTDSGATWTTRTYGAGIHPDNHAIVHDPGYDGVANKRIFIGNDGGIYKTDDITAAFASVAFTALNNNLGITQFYGAGGNATSGKIYGGTQDNGTLLYTPAGGTTWTERVGGDGGFSAADPTDPNYLYGEYTNLGLHRNDSGGTNGSSWIYGYSNATGTCKDAPYRIDDACNDKANFIAPFILDPNNANTLLAGGLSLWRSTDVKAGFTPTTGPAWAAIKAPDATTNNYINAIAVAPGSSDVIWVGHNTTGRLYRTINGTATTPTWVDMRGAGMPTTRAVTRFAIDPANSNTVYVAYGGFNAGNLWRTTNGGTTWTSASGTGATALPSAPIYTVVVHPTITDWVYVGTEVGIFASTDGGATWSLPHDGPANVSVDELFWMNGSLVAVTHGRGIFATSCSYTLSSATGTAAYTGGGGTLSVTAASSACAWTPTSNASWLTTSGTGTGNGSFTYTAAANTGAARTGTIAVGSATFTLTQATAPLMSLDRASLAFGATNTGGTLSNITATQAVTVTFAGASPTWIATTATPWLQVTGGAGTGNGQFRVSVINGAALPATGTVSGSVTVFSGGVGNSPLTVTVNLTLFASTAISAAPFGSFDTPALGATVAGSIAVTGWALDDIEVARVEIWRDLVAGETTPPYPGPGLGTGKVFIANAFFVNGARPDIESAPAYAAYPFGYRAGWGYLLLTQGLWNQGNGPFTLHAFAYDRDGHSTSLGSKAITVSNLTAVKPFGALDTPAYGQTVSGGFWNFGWALTPNASPTCTIGPAQVQMAIDSGTLVPVTYGDLRADIAGAFPGFSNGGGAGGAYYLDTTTLSNGTHQIGWFVTDSCGRAEGIGSRFFTVLNGSMTEPLDGPAKGGHHMDTDVVSADADVAPVARRLVRIAQNERVELPLPASGGTYVGYQVVNGERRALPLGSSLDAANGIFYWQPAPGFLGAFDLEFVSRPPSPGDRDAGFGAASGTAVRVRVVVGTAVQAVIDTPAIGGGNPFLGLPVGQPFTIAGWAIDLAATSGSGIDTVHVWAYPTDGAAPIFLGVADHGDARLDIGALFGEQFTGASFSLLVDGLASGTYDVVVYPHSAVTGDFRGAQVVRVKVP